MTPVPPPQQIGLQVTGTEANNQAGTNASHLIQTLQNLDNIRLWSEAYSAEELEALPGWPTPGTGAEYKSAMGEVPSVLAALEATQFLKKLGGMGLG
jgi:hypothetical protein